MAQKAFQLYHNIVTPGVQYFQQLIQTVFLHNSPRIPVDVTALIWIWLKVDRFENELILP